jgi:hypothetical protein
MAVRDSYGPKNILLFILLKFLRFALSLVVPLEPIIKRLRVQIPPLELGERK